MILNTKSTLAKATLLALLAVGLVVPSTGCVDLALMAMGAGIRQIQNDNLVHQQQAIDNQRAQRDAANLTAAQRLEQQNRELARQVEQLRQAMNQPPRQQPIFEEAYVVNYESEPEPIAMSSGSDKRN
jgi:uncharacterized protein YaiL (DUF2058 family)